MKRRFELKNSMFRLLFTITVGPRHIIIQTIQFVWLKGRLFFKNENMISSNSAIFKFSFDDISSSWLVNPFKITILSCPSWRSRLYYSKMHPCSKCGNFHNWTTHNQQNLHKVIMVNLVIWSYSTLNSHFKEALIYMLKFSRNVKINFNPLQFWP